MKATELSIQEKYPEKYLASLEKFSVIEGSLIDSSELIQNPNITLYCLDDRQKRAIFVETPEALNLYEAPFFYQAQFEHATRLLALSYSDFVRLSRAIPEPRNLIFIYSLGRCGSTLLSHCFNQLENTLSISEPDVFTHITGLREVDRSRDDALQEIARACAAFLLKSSPAKEPENYAFKLRGFCIEIADLIHRALPEAKNLFLYRNLDDWLRSMARLTKVLSPEKEGLIKKPNKPLIFDTYPRENFISYHRRLEKPGEALTLLGRFGLSWVSMMNRYLELIQDGIPFIALRYEDLIGQPEKLLGHVFDYCDLDQANAIQALKAFEKDSQEGTHFSGKSNRKKAASRELQQDHLEQARALLKIHPVIDHSHFILPHTLKV